ncbi:MAG: c-type cytochrome [Parvibaculales bacterium]
MRHNFVKMALLAALALPATPVWAHEPGSYESPIVEQRVKRFKQSGGDIQAIFKQHIGKKNFVAIEQAALRMAAWGRQMPDAFPEGSNSVGADPAIWENFSDFKAKSEAFANAAMRLKAVAGSRKIDPIKAAAQAVGASCKSCHESYRIKH